MQTRSMSCKNNMEYEVIIDFDEASTAWRANKKSTGNGEYKYICCHKTRNGNTCLREKGKDSEYCNQHKK